MGDLDNEATRIFQSSMASNSWRVYKFAFNRFSNFRVEYKLEPIWPVPVDHLIKYISYLSLAGFSVSTITTYISAVSYVHKIRHITDTTKCFILTKMMEGLKREGNSSDLRSPITISLLGRLVSVLSNVCSSDYEASMFSAAFTLAFFGLLRVGEFTANTYKDESDRPLQIKDIRLLATPPRIQMTIRKSKTDQRGKTFTLVINSAKAQLICPVRAMQKYLLMRPTYLCDQLFIHYDGTRLSRYQFSSLLKKTLKFCEVKSGCYKSHSFRIGMASECIRLGIPDETVKLWGRWSSNAYTRYIRIPPMA